jgi:hypothetical protein
VIFHPIDFIVFNGLTKTPEKIKNILLLDKAAKTSLDKTLQKSIEKAVSKGRYEWLTLRVEHKGEITEEKQPVIVPAQLNGIFPKDPGNSSQYTFFALLTYTLKLQRFFLKSPTPSVRLRNRPFCRRIPFSNLGQYYGRVIATLPYSSACLRTPIRTFTAYFFHEIPPLWLAL